MSKQHHSTNHHMMPVTTYLLVFAALMALFVLTVAVAYLDAGFLSRPIAIVIAVAKASLIMAFFMHLKYSSKLVWVIAGMGFFWLIILVVLTMSDYLARGSIPGII